MMKKTINSSVAQSRLVADKPLTTHHSPLTILVMCTGNSCRSIIGEALINRYLDNVKAFSAGVEPTGRVNPNAKKVLIEHNCWDKSYHSKHLDEVLDIEFDLVVTVCDHAKESCPMFPKPVKKIHVGFEDPDGKGYEEFEKTYQMIKKEFLPKVQEALNNRV
jgi:arsenate reductase